MELLIIPDCHLKPDMFSQAADIMSCQGITRAVCLMDIADDWGKETDLGLYSGAYGAAIAFSKSHPETLWCYGNHDISYLWERYESGYSPLAQHVVTEKLYELRSTLPDPGQLAFVHRVGRVLFSHGGISEEFVRRFIPMRYHDDTDRTLEKINSLGPDEMWQDFSPLWLRPQYNSDRMYRPRKFIQVVGHTPVKSVTKERNIISCDVFSTYRNGEPYGSREFPIIDTETGQYRCVTS